MIFKKQTVRDLPLHGKTVLLRADYNVPLEEDGSIADDFRVRQSLPTLHYLMEQQCKVVIIAHLGRPEGKASKKLSLEPIAQHLADLIGAPVHFVPNCVGDQVSQTVKHLGNTSIILLENLRFHSEEESNDESFARRLAHDSGADYFVQDGFGVVHRAHASTSAITQFLPSVAGLLLELEYTNLVQVRDHPKRPLVVVMGGAKIADKITLVKDFAQRADKVVIGGAIANNFLKWEGFDIGKSRVEEEAESIVSDIAHTACGETHDHRLCLRHTSTFLLPSDVAVSKSSDGSGERTVKKVSEIADDDYILDLGDNSIEIMIQALQGAKTVLWNGTLGMAEYDNFAHGSARLALWLAQQKGRVKSVIGGGDTADFVLHWDAAGGESFSHVSTGGGASLELLAGERLPGVDVLINKK